MLRKPTKNSLKRLSNTINYFYYLHTISISSVFAFNCCRWCLASDDDGGGGGSDDDDDDKNVLAM